MSKEGAPRLGGKVRVLRRREGLTQAVMAERLQISASYLNLIEHNRRPLTAPLLIRLAQQFDIDLQDFSEDEAAQVAGDLLEVFGDPMFDRYELTNIDVREMASTNPQLGRAVVALYRAFRSSRESADALAASLADGSDDDRNSRLLLPSEEVNDLFQKQQNYFADIEAAAEALVDEAKLDFAGDLYHDLVRHLYRAFGVSVDIRRPTAMGGAVRRYDPERRLLTISEILRPGSRNFQIAHVLGLLSHSDLFDSSSQDESLLSEASLGLVRVALANYFAGAVLMPYDPFARAALEERYDIELLSHRFNVSFEQACHRLTTLQRPGSRGVPLHLVRIDVAGNISKRFSASGLRFARFSASCPLWNVHSAFQASGRVRVQISRMPSGDTYLCAARTLRRSVGGYNSPEALQSLAIGCDISDARALIYSDGIDLERDDRFVEVGVTCQICDRSDCAQRAMPTIRQPLTVDENVRGVSFFASLKS